MKTAFTLSGIALLMQPLPTVDSFVVERTSHQLAAAATSSASTSALYSAVSPDQDQQLCPLLPPPENPDTTFEAAMG